MQADGIADQLRRQDIPLEELPGGEDGRDQPDRRPVAPELEQRETDGEHPAHQGTDVGDEGDQARDGPHH